MDKTGEDYNGLRLGKFEELRSTFLQIYGMLVKTCIQTSFTQLENRSPLLRGHDFAKQRLLVCQFDV